MSLRHARYWLMLSLLGLVVGCSCSTDEGATTPTSVDDPQTPDAAGDGGSLHDARPGNVHSNGQQVARPTPQPRRIGPTDPTPDPSEDSTWTPDSMKDLPPGGQWHPQLCAVLFGSGKRAGKGFGSGHMVDVQLSRFKNFPDLRQLYIETAVNITDDGLAGLEGLHGVRELSLPPQIGDRGLANLGGMNNLQTLNLHATVVTDAGLVHLAGFKDLRTLDLSATQVRGKGLEHVARLTNLTKLDLGGCLVNDAALVYLASLANLQELDLSTTRVTDTGMAALTPLANLKQLNLWGTEVTAEGVAILREANPELKIAR